MTPPVVFEPTEEERAAADAALEHLLRRSRSARGAPALVVDHLASTTALHDRARSSTLARVDLGAVRHAARLLRPWAGS